MPFGAARRDWAALELGAWISRATGAPLRLIGRAERERGSRREPPAGGRLVIVQRTAGVVAEPLLAAPGRRA